VHQSTSLTAGAWVALALAALPGCSDSGGSESPPNVLLISLDSTRRDQLGCYGRRSPYAPELSTTPNIDALAARGVRLTQAYSTTSWTLPSHLALLSGNPEIVHGVDLDSHAPAEELPRLPELLRKAGYRTSGFFSGPYLEASFGFDRGFERYERCYGPDLLRAVERQERRKAQREQSGPSAPNVKVDGLSHRDVSSVNVTDGALSAIEAAETEGRPWFVFAHYFDPHYDYIPPAPFDEQFDPDYSGPIDGKDFFDSPAISSKDMQRPGRRIRHVDERGLEHVRSLYDGELAWTDSQVARLFERIAELGADENTLVIICADHGDEFFEHDGIGHRRTLYEEVTQVPLILSWPAGLPQGQTVAGVVSLTGVLATVLELAGLECDVPVEPGFASRLRRSGEQADGEAMGRLIATSVVDLKLRDATAKAQLVELHEAFWSSGIKILRRRSWPELGTPLDAELTPVFERIRERMYTDEELAWIDLAAHPDEALDAYSTDFSDPRASAALERFAKRYERLVQRRASIGALGQRTDAGGMSQQLEALGYASAGDLDEGRERDWLVLPAPALRR